MSLLVVGSVAFDTVKTPYGQAEEVLGGSATYASLAAGIWLRYQLARGRPLYADRRPNDNGTTHP